MRNPFVSQNIFALIRVLYILPRCQCCQCCRVDVSCVSVPLRAEIEEVQVDVSELETRLEKVRHEHTHARTLTQSGILPVYTHTHMNTHTYCVLQKPGRTGLASALRLT